MAEFRTLGPGVLVSAQISADDIATAAAMGVTHVVNNRPDGEEYGQPAAAEIESVARAAGLAYHHAPIRGFPDAEAVQAVGAILEAAKPGDVILMHCKSGMRSTAVWAMARRSRGADADALRAAAAAAGYDLSRLPL
jgi:uncharacterized protein (TIGR01244 family)